MIAVKYIKKVINMEKILFKKMASSFAILSLLFIIVFSCSFYFIQINSVRNSMDEMLTQVELLYEKSCIDTKEKTELYILIERMPLIFS